MPTEGKNGLGKDGDPHFVVWYKPIALVSVNIGCRRCIGKENDQGEQRTGNDDGGGDVFALTRVW